MKKVDGRSKAARAEKEQFYKEMVAREARIKSEQVQAFEASLHADARQVGGGHYMNKGVQSWEAMEAWMTPEQFVGFLRGNAIKYLARCDAKGGIEDLKKAQHYLNKLIEFSEER